jgi:hypothetical protein
MADEARHQADAHSTHVTAEVAVGFRAHDRFAVSEYVQTVLDKSLPSRGTR